MNTPRTTSNDNRPIALRLPSHRTSLARAAAALAAALTCLMFTVAASGQSDDDDAPDEEATQARRFELSESAYESFVFGHEHTAFELRAQQEKLLELNIDDLDRSGKLSDAQRKKLQLAGRADIKRFFEDVEAMRKKFLLVRRDSRRINDVLQEIRPLQLKLTGLFANESMFGKTLRMTVSAEVLARYRQNQHERQALRHQAKVEWVVAMFDNAMSLRDEQRQKIIRLLVDHTKPPRKSSDLDHYVIMWQLSRLPEDTVRPLFDDLQWKVLQKEFEQLRDIERHLKQHGYLTFDDEKNAEREGTQPHP